jgi:hypothetical protein
MTMSSSDLDGWGVQDAQKKKEKSKRRGIEIEISLVV